MNNSSNYSSESFLSSLDDIKKAFHVHRLSGGHYWHAEIYKKLNQVMHSNNGFCYIDKARCHELAFLYVKYKYAVRCMWTV